METIKLFMVNTPWYVYLIFIYLLKIGIKSVQGQTVHIGKLFAIPGIFMAMSIDEMINNFGFNLNYVVIFIIGLLCGIVFGYRQFNALIYQVDKQAKTLQLSGSYSSLILILATFCFKYYMGYKLATTSAIPIVQLSLLLFISTIFTGAFVGRLVISLRKLK